MYSLTILTFLTFCLNLHWNFLFAAAAQMELKSNLAVKDNQLAHLKLQQVSYA